MEKNTSQSIAIIYSASLSLHFFWVLNILKESYGEIKNFLNFYPPVGPLLGLFTFSIAVFVICFIALQFIRWKNQKAAFYVILISSIVFFFMVFPPLFKPIAGILQGN